MIPFYETRRDEIFGFRCNRLNYPLHLQATVEFVYVASGHLTVTLNGECHTMHEGELVVIFPNCTHSYDTPFVPTLDHNAQTQDLIVDDILLLGAQTSMTGEYAEGLTHNQPQRPFLPADLVPPEIPQSIRRLLQQDATRNPDLPLCRAYLQLILALVWPHLQLKPTCEHDFDDLVYQVSAYIVQNYQKSFSLEDMANALGVSKYRLSRIFSNQMRMSFNEHLNNVRVSVAQGLLSSTDKPITDIIYDCGFESQATFNRVFRKICGVSPREYRRGHRFT